MISRKNLSTYIKETKSKVNEERAIKRLKLVESFIETVEWCLNKSIPVIKAFPLMLLRGTDIEQRKHEWNLIESNDSMPTVIQSDSFSYSEWLDMFRISEALKQTESNHPKSIEQLLEISKHVHIDYDRFRPNTNLEVKQNQLQPIEI